LTAGCQQGCRQNGFAGNQENAEFAAQINRLKEIFKIGIGPRTDRALADIFGISKQAINKWRYAGVPGARIDWASKKTGISRDWIAMGESIEYEPGVRKPPKIGEQKIICKRRHLNEKILTNAIQIIEKTMVDIKTYSLRPAEKTQIILIIYDILLETNAQNIPKSMIINLIKLAKYKEGD